MSWQRRIPTATDVASRMMNPFGGTRAATTKPVVKLIADIEPEPKKVYVEPVRPETYILPSYDPDEFTGSDYWHAWQSIELLCDRAPAMVDYCKSDDVYYERRLPPTANLLLVQMQDSFGTVSRLNRLLMDTYGTRIFQHTDEPVDTFLPLLRAGRTFGPTTAIVTPAVAVFYYPTEFVLEELKLADTAGVRVVIVLDDIYISAARALRLRAAIVIIKPFSPLIMEECKRAMARMWRIDATPDLLARCGTDPRRLFHLMYFERLQIRTSVMRRNVYLERDLFQWVHFWFLHGSQKLFEYHFRNVSEPVKTLANGVVYAQLAPKVDQNDRTTSGTVVAWEYAALPQPQTRESKWNAKASDSVTKTEVMLLMDPDVSTTLAYLHFMATKAVFWQDPAVFTNANTWTWDLLSVADTQQSRFQPTVSPLHEGAVRYGIHRARGNKKLEHEDQTDIPRTKDKALPQKPFLDWLNYQAVSKKRAAKALELVEFAPVIQVHKSETLARLYFMADPTGIVTYWPTRKLASAWHYFQEAALTEMALEEEMAWRLVWGLVHEMAQTDNRVPERPKSGVYRRAKLDPELKKIKCCEASSKYAFSWCLECGAPPSDPVVRCKYCFGWGSCAVCASYNKQFAVVAARASALEKI